MKGHFYFKAALRIFLSILCISFCAQVFAQDYMEDPPSKAAEILAKYESSNAKKISAKSDPLNIQITQIDISQFPYIKTFVSVFDNNRIGIQNLTGSEIALTEQASNETSVTLESVDVTQIKTMGENMNLALVFDRSGSMVGQPIEDSKTAFKAFVDNFNNLDRAALVSFNHIVTTDQPFTFMDDSGKNNFKSNVDSLSAGGSTALLDACLTAIDLSAKEVGTKAVIIFTDGGENASVHNDMQDTINAAREANIPIYTIGLSGGNLSAAFLQKLADDTGGSFYFSPTASDLVNIYSEIKAKIQAQYVLAYYTHNPIVDSTIRTVTTTVNYNSNSDSDSKTYKSLLAPQIILTDETKELSNNISPQNSSLPIKADIIGGNSITSASLWYRQTGSESAYSQAPMILKYGSLYSGEIPSGDVYEPGVDYYLTATDGVISSSEPSIDPQNNPNQIPVGANGAPLISHVPISTAAWNTGIDVTAHVKDNTDNVDAVTLYYRKAGQPLYNSLIMNRESGNNIEGDFKGVIPAGVNTPDSPPGCDYYIEAADNHGLKSSHGAAKGPHRINYQPNQLMLGAKWCASCGSAAAGVMLSAWAYDSINGNPVSKGLASYRIYNSVGSLVLSGNLKHDADLQSWTSEFVPFNRNGIFTYECNINGITQRISFSAGQQKTTISGDIVDRYDQNLAGAGVQLIKKTISKGAGITETIIATKTSGVDGSFAFSSLPAGSYWIKAEKSGLKGSMGPFYSSGNTYKKISCWDLAIPIDTIKEVRDAIFLLMDNQAGAVAAKSAEIDDLVAGSSWYDVVYKYASWIKMAVDVKDIIKNLANIKYNQEALGLARWNLNKFDEMSNQGTLASKYWEIRPDLVNLVNAVQVDYNGSLSQLTATLTYRFLDKIRSSITPDAESQIRDFSRSIFTMQAGSAINNPITLGERSFTQPAIDFWVKSIDEPDTQYISRYQSILELFLPDNCPWGRFDSIFGFGGTPYHKQIKDDIVNSEYFASSANLLDDIYNYEIDDVFYRSQFFSGTANISALKSYADRYYNQLTSGKVGKFYGPLNESFPISLQDSVSNFDQGADAVRNLVAGKMVKMGVFVILGSVVTTATAGAATPVVVGAAFALGIASATAQGILENCETGARVAQFKNYIQLIDHFASSIYSAPFILDRFYTSCISEMINPYYTDPNRTFKIALRNPSVQNKEFSFNYSNNGDECDAYFLMEHRISGLSGSHLTLSAAEYKHLPKSDLGQIKFALNEDLFPYLGFIWSAHYVTLKACAGINETGVLTYDTSWWKMREKMNKSIVKSDGTVPIAVSNGKPLSLAAINKYDVRSIINESFAVSATNPDFEKTITGSADSAQIDAVLFAPDGAPVDIIAYDKSNSFVGYSSASGIIENQFPAIHSGRFTSPQTITIPNSANKVIKIAVHLSAEEYNQAEYVCSLIIKETPKRPDAVMQLMDGDILKNVDAGMTFSLMSKIAEASFQKPLIDVQASISGLIRQDGKILVLKANETSSLQSDPIISAGSVKNYEWHFYAPADSTGDYYGAITYKSSAGNLNQNVFVHVNSNCTITIETDPAGIIIDDTEGKKAAPYKITKPAGTKFWLTAPGNNSPTQTFTQWMKNGSIFSNAPDIEIIFAEADVYKAVYYTAPLLSWTKEQGFESDGLNPEIGNPATKFIYAIIYSHASNIKPAEGYPKLHILKGGQEISVSPMSMNGNSFTDYVSGRKYSFETTLLAGNDYSYFFEARDEYNTIAHGAPTNVLSGPVVVGYSAITVKSDPAGQKIEDADNGGVTEYKVIKNLGEAFYLRAPDKSNGGLQFKEWLLNGNFLSSNPRIDFTINDGDVYTAIYKKFVVPAEIETIMIDSLQMSDLRCSLSSVYTDIGRPEKYYQITVDISKADPAGFAGTAALYEVLPAGPVSTPPIMTPAIIIPLKGSAIGWDKKIGNPTVSGKGSGKNAAVSFKAEVKGVRDGNTLFASVNYTITSNTKETFKGRVMVRGNLVYPNKIIAVICSGYNNYKNDKTKNYYNFNASIYFPWQEAHGASGQETRTTKNNKNGTISISRSYTIKFNPKKAGSLTFSTNSVLSPEPLPLSIKNPAALKVYETSIKPISGLQFFEFYQQE